MKISREIALSAAAAALFVAALLASADWKPATAMFPDTISTVGLGFALWALVGDVLKQRAATPDAEEPETLSKEDRARARGAFIWIAIFFAAVLLIGFQWGFTAASLVFYRVEARVGWVGSIIAAGACGAFLYAAAHFLGIPLYDGVVIDMLS